MFDRILNQLKSAKVVVSSRLYYSSMIDKVSDTLLEDSPYTVMNTLLSSPSVVTGIASNRIVTEHYMQIELTTALFLFLLYVNFFNKNNKTQRLETLVESYAIKRNINRFLFIFFTIFTKNIENAI